MELGRKNLLRTPTDFAINSAHGVAFHRGLGVPLHPASSTAVHKYVSEGSISAYASAAYAKPNFAVVANGAAHDELAKWVGEFFQDSPAAAPKDLPALESPATTYHGGEERIAHDGGNAMTLGFPGSSSFTAGSTYKPELAVLTALLGGESNIKWSSGFSLLSRAAEGHPGCRISTTHAPYSDAGLLYVTLQGSAQSIREASYNVVEAIKMVSNGEVSKEDITKAVASAKFKALEAGQNIDAGLELTGAGLVQGGKAYQMDEVAKGIDNVTPDQVKKVDHGLLYIQSTANLFFRLPKQSSTVKHPFPLLVISSSFLTQKRLD
jgi:ubiquinol-cytochrome c reductase core subunit 2